jgi:YggT family protein
MTDPITLIAEPIGIFLNIYIALLFIRILLSWFPTIDWMNPPFSILSQLTDPYLNIFRSFIPPLGGIDLSPMLAIFLLGFVAQAVTGLAGGGQAMY